MKYAIEKLLLSYDISQLTDSDKVSIKDIFLQSVSDEIINSYFSILLQYLNAKRDKKMSTDAVAKASGFPPTTIKRFENLQTIPQALTLMKILNSVGVELSVTEK